MKCALFTYLFCIFLGLAEICALSATPAYAADDTDGVISDLHKCNINYLTKEYVGTDVASAKQSCWYCTIVIIMTNAFLQTAATALPTSQSLGHLIVKLGFSIWLTLYILKQISSMGGITPGKMLQEILVMGFKCAFAYWAISDGLNFIVDYILNPIMLTGTDIGTAILDKMLET